MKAAVSERCRYYAGELPLWPIGREPETTLEAGWLRVVAGMSPAVLAQPARSPSFIAETRLEVPSDGSAGLALFGNDTNYLALLVQSGQARVLLRLAEEKEIAARPLPAERSIKLRITSADGTALTRAKALSTR